MYVTSWRHTDITDDILKCKLTNGWNLILQLKARGQMENIILDLAIMKRSKLIILKSSVITWISFCLHFLPFFYVLYVKALLYQFCTVMILQSNQRHGNLHRLHGYLFLNLKQMQIIYIFRKVDLQLSFCSFFIIHEEPK